MLRYFASSPYKRHTCYQNTKNIVNLDVQEIKAASPWGPPPQTWELQEEDSSKKLQECKWSFHHTQNNENYRELLHDAV